MRKLSLTFRFAACLAGLFLSTGVVSAGEKKLMHCFTFTAVEGASDADWQAFFEATDALPAKIPGVSRVWYGKLRSPLTQFLPDAKTRKELAGGAKTATGEVTRLQRQWGVCMEMNDEAALKTYAGHPSHQEWNQAYFKVRMPGTLTFDILGQ